MAIINSSHNFVFVHIPKAAGTSVSRYFSRFSHYCDLEIGGTDFGESIQTPYQRRFGLSKHSPASAIRNTMGVIAWSKAFTFCFVRNPYSRLLSTYNFLCEWPGCPEELQRTLLSFDSLDDYVLSGIWQERRGPDGIFLPQTQWTSEPSSPRRLLVDYVAKVESIEEELGRLARAIGLKEEAETVAAPMLNRSEPRYRLEDLSGRAVDLIDAHYRLDFEIFDYPFGEVT